MVVAEDLPPPEQRLGREVLLLEDLIRFGSPSAPDTRQLPQLHCFQVADVPPVEPVTVEFLLLATLDSPSCLTAITGIIRTAAISQRRLPVRLHHQKPVSCFDETESDQTVE